MDSVEFSLDSWETLAGLFGLGVMSHVFALRKGEWDLWTMKFIYAWITYEAVVPCALIQFRPMAYIDAIFTANMLLSAFISGMTISILTYRAFFHRLNRFPGPFIARLTNVYATWLAIKEEHMYLEVQELHKKYGDIVRIGRLIVLSCSKSISDMLSRPHGTLNRDAKRFSHSACKQFTSHQRPIL